VKSLNSKMVSFLPDATKPVYQQIKGSVVVCKGGACPGSRIHFSPPSLDLTADDGEPLVNGEAYFAPQGVFSEFWIESPPMTLGQILANERIKLLVLDCADPVVVLNDLRGAGYKYHCFNSGQVAEITFASGGLTLYDDGAPQMPELTDTTSSMWSSRGWIGGALVCTNPQPYRVVFSEYIDGAGNKAELSRLFVNQADNFGRFSCSFAFGMQNTFSGGGSIIRNGAIFMPYPPRGLRVDIVPTVGDLGQTNWFLYERNHAV